MKSKQFNIVRNRNFVKDYLSKHPCIDCGNGNIVVLDFDHVTDTKIANISRMVANGASFKTLLKEVLKCEVRCANCHRIVTHRRRNQQSTIEGVDYIADDYVDPQL
jgi:hypothetical protein